jgi:hypothetical protein
MIEKASYCQLLAIDRASQVLPDCYCSLIENKWIRLTIIHTYRNLSNGQTKIQQV